MIIRSRSGQVVCVAAVIGLAVRLAILAATADLEPKVVDERHYVQLATNLVRGHGFGWGLGDLTSIRPPLYPALLAAVWRVTGEGSFQTVRGLQILLSALTAWLVYRLGCRVFGEDAGRYAGAAAWLYPSFVFANFMILTETLFTLLFVTFVLLTVRLVQAPAASTAIACGLALGCGALTRSVLWPLPFVLCPMLALLLRGSILRRLLMPALVFAGFAVVVVPWAVRNTRLQGVTTIVDTMGGLNLRMGNYEHTPDDRMWDAVSIRGEQSWSHALQAEFPGQTLTEGQKDKWAQKTAIEYMLANPATTLRRAAIKFADFWGLEREFAAGIMHGIYSPPSWFGTTASLLIVVTYMVVALLFAISVWLAAPEWRLHALLLLPVAAIMGVHTIVFAHSRYHLPLVPIMALYGAAFLTQGRTLDLRRRRSAIAGALFCVALLAVIWGRQVFVVEGERIRTLFGHGG